MLAIFKRLLSLWRVLTPSNSYRFAWQDAAIERNTNNIVNAYYEQLVLS